MADEVLSSVRDGIVANAPLSLQGMKATVQRALAPREGIRHDDLDALALRARTSADAGEGRRAMLEQRRPVFRGE
jgi:enoyl-CoA hydratase/carnithine racemase